MNKTGRTGLSSRASVEHARRAALVLAVGLAAGLSDAASAQALRLLDSASVGTVQVPTDETVVVNATFSGVAEPVIGIGLSGLFTGVIRDDSGGLGPWALDVRLAAEAPSGARLTWTPIGGDRTIADYPLQDATGGLAPSAGDGQWAFEFSSTEASSVWVYALLDTEVYLLGDAPLQSLQFDAEPDPAQQWDRPFFIEGISGLGPVAYTAFVFEVDESGLYEFESVLPTAADHFTFLYRGSFDPSQPLTNLLDYGLGNGNSPLNVPRGTSRIEALLFEGQTYIWVTSQWSRFSAIQVASNTVAGPGMLIDPGGCTGDIADDTGTLGELDGQVSFGDFLALLGLLGPCPGSVPGCAGDIADDTGMLGAADGQISFGDFLALLGLLGPCT